jgi:hypothetical protein
MMANMFAMRSYKEVCFKNLFYYIKETELTKGKNKKKSSENLFRHSNPQRCL